MQDSVRPVDGSLVKNPCRLQVLPDWTDYNDHFNVAYYMRAFDEATAVFRTTLLGRAAPVFQPLRCRVDYLNEVAGGRALRFTTQVMGASVNHLHLLQTLRDAQSDDLAAIEERVETPAHPLDEAALSAIRAVAREHATLPVPAGWGDLAAASGFEAQNGC